MDGETELRHAESVLNMMMLSEDADGIYLFWSIACKDSGAV